MNEITIWGFDQLASPLGGVFHEESAKWIKLEFC